MTSESRKRSKLSLSPVHNKSITFKESTVSDDGKKVSGYLSTFGVKDSDGDIIIKGAYAKSLNERGPNSTANGKIAFLWQHDMTDPIGRFTALQEDNQGLYFEAELDEGIPSADRALKQLQSGTLNQFSIGFQYVWDKMEYVEDLDAFVIKEVNLFEGSVVTLGANGYTYFDGMKSDLLESETEKTIKETEAFIKSLPKEFQYKARTVISKNIALSVSQPGKPLIKSKEPREPELDLSQVNFFQNIQI